MTRARIGGERVVQFLIATLTDEHAVVRGAAAWALEQIDTAEARKAVEEYREQSDEEET